MDGAIAKLNADLAETWGQIESLAVQRAGLPRTRASEPERERLSEEIVSLKEQRKLIEEEIRDLQQLVASHKETSQTHTAPSSPSAAPDDQVSSPPAAQPAETADRTPTGSKAKSRVPTQLPKFRTAKKSIQDADEFISALKRALCAYDLPPEAHWARILPVVPTYPPVYNPRSETLGELSEWPF